MKTFVGPHSEYSKLRIKISVLHYYGHSIAEIAERVGLSEPVVNHILKARVSRNRKKRTEYHREWRRKNRDKVNLSKRRYYEKLRKIGEKYKKRDKVFICEENE